MTTVLAPHPPTTDRKPVPVLASMVLSVVIRVAGP
jgi:hypothetical protein